MIIKQLSFCAFCAFRLGVSGFGIRCLETHQQQTRPAGTEVLQFCRSADALSTLRLTSSSSNARRETADCDSCRGSHSKNYTDAIVRPAPGVSKRTSTRGGNPLVQNVGGKGSGNSCSSARYHRPCVFSRCRDDRIRLVAGRKAPNMPDTSLLPGGAREVRYN